MTRLAQANGESDIGLASRLKEEIKYEAEQAPAKTPDFLRTFREEGVWEIKEKEGSEDVELLRTFGNESIRVFFSIADIDNDQPQFQGEEGEEEIPPSPYAVRCTATITKPEGGALVVELTAEEGGAFIIDGVSYYADERLANDMSMQAELDRRGVYIGPQFDNLDVQVQEEFEKYIQERGINEELAAFIPDFAEYKEQKEYVKWLDNVTNFIEA
ncbi:mitochondrial glyco protein [Calocera viscosa TUFC12733]|uniref:Mitochondrial glyco protein n=1 Tax=Calocera viscosa (strain TUFC12733) TaxID=1330018 RepID=A0A167L8R4_CALVF|nr:mitochondrial glyco protein [Calocera viscosa TUFC12733]